MHNVSVLCESWIISKEIYQWKRNMKLMAYNKNVIFNQSC